MLFLGGMADGPINREAALCQYKCATIAIRDDVARVKKNYLPFLYKKMRPAGSLEAMVISFLKLLVPTVMHNLLLHLSPSLKRSLCFVFFLPFFQLPFK